MTCRTEARSQILETKRDETSDMVHSKAGKVRKEQAIPLLPPA